MHLVFGSPQASYYIIMHFNVDEKCYICVNVLKLLKLKNNLKQEKNLVLEWISFKAQYLQHGLCNVMCIHTQGNISMYYRTQAAI